MLPPLSELYYSTFYDRPFTLIDMNLEYLFYFIETLSTVMAFCLSFCRYFTHFLEDLKLHWCPRKWIRVRFLFDLRLKHFMYYYRIEIYPSREELFFYILRLHKCCRSRDRFDQWDCVYFFLIWNFL